MGKNDSPVSQFLRRVVQLANTEITSYGTLNVWKAAPEKKKKKLPPLKSRTTRPGVPTNSLITLEGKIGVGQTSPYAIDGHDIFVNSNTMVVGDLLIGATARVKLAPGGKAKSVVVTAVNE
jgi:hypothetical protein